MSPILMTQLAREYWCARENSDSPASKGFFRTQADKGYWPTIQKLCAAHLEARESAMYAEHVATTSFSEAVS